MSNQGSSPNTNQDSNQNNLVHIHKMLLVFNAILSGWTVRLSNRNTFEFKKDTDTQDVNLDEYVKKFITNNLNVDLFKNSQQTYSSGSSDDS